MSALAAVLLAQAFFVASATMQKFTLNERGFSFATLVSPKLLVSLLPAAAGFALLMYGLSKGDLSRTIILLGVSGAAFSAVAGMHFFNDQLQWWNWLGVGLAVLAIALVNWK